MNAAGGAAVTLRNRDEARFVQPSHQERRRTTRVHCQAPVELTSALGTVRGVCNDISLGGMLFLGPLISVGHHVKLAIEIFGLGAVQVEGEILAHRDLPQGWGMAIRFMSLKQQDLKLISQFVADRLGWT